MSAVEVPCQIDGRRDAPALVLSNSLGSTRVMWDPQVPALAEDFCVVRYEHRGHDGAPVPPAPYELDDLGADVLALMDRLEIARAHFCGLSLGGMVGMWLAIHAPDRVDRLVACCTSAMLADEHDWAARAALVRAEGTGAVAESVVARWFTPAFAGDHPDLTKRMRAMLVATPAEGYAACCGVIERMDLLPDLAALRAPTLVIAGTQHPATPPHHAQRIGELIPDCRVELVEAAHLANVEQPRAVTELIRSHVLVARSEETTQ